MYNALGIFTAVYEYICPISNLSTPSPILSFFCCCFFLSLLPSNSSWKTRKQASSLGPTPLLAARSMEQKTHTHKHTPTSPTPNTLRSELLTQIQTHWSHPQWNESGESQVNIAVYRHVFANANA